MDELKVRNWEWILVETYDRRGRPVTKMVRVPREYEHVPYEQPKGVEVDENEKIIDF